jgi:hypothetical protein
LCAERSLERGGTLERAMGIEPTTYSLGSFVESRDINIMTAKLCLLMLNRIKYIEAMRKTRTALNLRDGLVQKIHFDQGLLVHDGT